MSKYDQEKLSDEMKGFIVKTYRANCFNPHTDMKMKSSYVYGRTGRSKENKNREK